MRGLALFSPQKYRHQALYRHPGIKRQWGKIPQRPDPTPIAQRFAQIAITSVVPVFAMLSLHELI